MSFTIGVEGGASAVVLAAASAALAAWHWRVSGAPGAIKGLRVLTLLWLSLCLLQASPQRTRTSSSKPKLALIVDVSPAMAAFDGGKRSRVGRAADWISRHRAELEARADPILFAGADRAQRVSWAELGGLKAQAAGLDPARAFETAAKEGASRAWLLSDGGPGFAPGPQESRPVPVPVDALGAGPPGSAKLARAAELRAPDFVFLHSRFPIAASIEAEGLKGSAVSVKLWKGERLLAERSLEVRQDFEVLPATFTALAESLGQEEYRLETGAPGSPSDARELQVEVIRQKHRIMYLAGRPSFEYSHLREYLKSDPNHELVSFVILRNPENTLSVSDQELSLIPFPAREIFVTDLMQFDLFILENFAYWRFSLPPLYLENLRRFVSRGGALLVIGGADAFSQGGYRGTPLEQVLPVNLWSGPRDYAPGLVRPKTVSPDHPLLRVGDTADASKGLWEALPPLDGFNRFAGLKPGASLLLAHPSEKTSSGSPAPILAVGSYGKGRVMALGTDSTWRWRLGAGLDWRLSSFYGRFWSGAVQYLSGTLDLKKLRFSPMRKRLTAVAEPLSVTLHLFDAGFRPLSGAEADLRVSWTPPGGEARPVVPLEKEPGVFEVRLTGLSEGEHSLAASARYRGQAWGEDRLKFFWDPRPPRLPLNRRWLKELSAAAQGRYADLERVDIQEWLRALPAPRPEREVLRRWHPWDSPWALAVLAALLLLEWILRRRRGLL